MSQSNVKLFEKEEFGKVRVVMQDEDPWFVAKDVCGCLEIGNSRDAVASLDDDEKGVGIIDTPGGKQEMSIVSEPGLYSLILRSRKPEAKALPWFLEVFIDVPAAYSVAGRKLSELSRRLGYEIREVEDTRYGIVKAYHADVITAFRVALRDDLNMMRKYRR